MLKCSDRKTAIFSHLGGLINTGYCGASDFKMQEGRMSSTTLISIEDDLTLNINSTLVMILV